MLQAGVLAPVHDATHGLIALFWLLADPCIMRVCDCKKDTGIKSLMKLHLSKQLSILRLGDFRYTVMPFGITVARMCSKESLTSALGRLIK